MIQRISLLSQLYMFTGACMPIFALYGIMFQDEGGLSTSEISVLFMVFMTSTIVSELPTGAMGDRFSRRTLLVISPLLQAAAFALWMLFPTFTGYAISFVIWGFGVAMSSGTFQAYLYDELRELNASDSFTKIYGRTQSMLLFGLFVGYAAIPVLGATNYDAQLVFSIVVTLMSALVGLMLPKERIHVEPTTTLKALTNGVREVRRSKILLCYTASIALVAGCVTGFADYVPITLHVVGIQVDHVSIALQAGILVSVVLTWNIHRFEKWSEITTCLFVIAAGLLLFSAAYLDTVPAAVCIMAWGRAIRVASPLFQASMQHHVEGTSRATISSLGMFLSELIAIAYMGAYGVAAAVSDDIFAIQVVAVMTLATGIFLIALWRSNRVILVKKPQQTIAS